MFEVSSSTSASTSALASLTRFLGASFFDFFSSAAFPCPLDTVCDADCCEYFLKSTYAAFSTSSAENSLEESSFDHRLLIVVSFSKIELYSDLEYKIFRSQPLPGRPLKFAVPCDSGSKCKYRQSSSEKKGTFCGSRRERINDAVAGPIPLNLTRMSMVFRTHLTVSVDFDGFLKSI